MNKTDHATVSMLEFIDENQLHSNWPHWSDDQLACKCKELCEQAVASRLPRELTPSMKRVLADWVQEADWFRVAAAVRSRTANRVLPGMNVAYANRPDAPIGVVVYLAARDDRFHKRDVYVSPGAGRPLLKLPEEELVRAREGEAWFAVNIEGLEEQPPAESCLEAMILVLCRYEDGDIHDMPVTMTVEQRAELPVMEYPLAAQIVAQVGAQYPHLESRSDTQQAACEFVRYVTRFEKRFAKVKSVEVATKDAIERMHRESMSGECEPVGPAVREWAASRGVLQLDEI